MFRGRDEELADALGVTNNTLGRTEHIRLSARHTLLENRDVEYDNSDLLSRDGDYNGVMPKIVRRHWAEIKERKAERAPH